MYWERMPTRESTYLKGRNFKSSKTFGVLGHIRIGDSNDWGSEEQCTGIEMVGPAEVGGDYRSQHSAPSRRAGGLHTALPGYRNGKPIWRRLDGYELSWDGARWEVTSDSGATALVHGDETLPEFAPMVGTTCVVARRQCLHELFISPPD